MIARRADRDSMAAATTGPALRGQIRLIVAA